jgi:hypothetical protein
MIMRYRFQVHALIENGIAYTCVTYITNKYYLPFVFLETVKKKFLEVPSLLTRAVTASENEFDRDFCPVLAQVVVSTKPCFNTALYIIIVTIIGT